MKKIVMMLCVAMFMLGASAYTWYDSKTGIKWTYTVSDGKASVGGGTSSSPAVPKSTAGAITIPSKLNGYAVTSIGGFAFSGCKDLTNVKIPTSVTSIGKMAFFNCSGLTSAIISASVKTIHEDAFRCCTGLTSVSIGEGVTYIGTRMFSGCTGLTSVLLPTSMIDIHDGAFSYCSGLRYVSIPASVVHVGSQAFCGCDLLGNGVVIVDGCVLTVNGCCPSVVNIPEGTRLIASGAFKDCIELTSVTIPSSIEYIGSGSFEGSGLANATIDYGVTSIDDGAFYGCSRLVNVMMPSSVKRIGGSAFYGCAELMNMDMPSNVTNIGQHAFYNCQGITSVTIPAGVTCINDCSFIGCSGLTEVLIPSNVTSIGECAFDSCTGLTSVMIHEGVTNIGACAFYGCVALTSVSMPESVISIGKEAFAGCNGLTHVTIPASVHVGVSAFPLLCKVVRCVLIEVGGGLFNCVYDGIKHEPAWRFSPDCSCVCVCEDTWCDVGVYEFTAEATDFYCADEGYDASFCVNGSCFVNVEKRNVSVISLGEVKIYDGTPLTGGFDIGGMGFVDGECEVSATGSQTGVGSSVNDVQLNWIGNGKASNYDLTITKGTLTVLPADVSQDGEEPWGGDGPRP